MIEKNVDIWKLLLFLQVVQIWFPVFLFFCWICSISGDSPTYSACKQPLGSESGKFQENDVYCTSYNSGDDCKNACHRVTYHGEGNRRYWCGTHNMNDFGYFAVTFPHFQYVSGFAIKSKPGMTIKRTILLHGYRSDRLIPYGSEEDEVGKVFDTDSEDVMVWLNETILTKTIGFWPYNLNGTQYASQFEIYGCPFWEKIGQQPVGMENGLIGDDQITSYHGYGRQYHNPGAARLNTASMAGWWGSGSDVHTYVNSRNVYLQIDLGLKQKVISIAVQQMRPEGDDSTVQNRAYFVHYGEDDSAMKPYTGTPADDHSGSFTSATIIQTAATTEIFKTGSYAFKYPLVAKYVRYFTNTAEKHPHTKIELYSVPFFTATHHWSLRSGSLKDQVVYSDLVSSPEQVTFEEDGAKIENTMVGLRTMPLHEDDCIHNVDKCDSGISISFSAKVSEPPKGVLYQIDIAAQSMYTTSCQTAGIDLQNMVGLFIERINIMKSTSVLSSTRLDLPDMTPVESSNLMLKVTAFAGVAESFITSCEYSSSLTVYAALHYVYIDRTAAAYEILGLNVLIDKILDSGGWQYGSSLALVFEPVTSAELLLPESLALNVYVQHACFDYQEDYVDSLSDSMFSQSGSNCTDTDKLPSNVKFNKDGQWRNCGGGDNYLEIDLEFPQYITLIKVKSNLSSWARLFSVHYLGDESTWFPVTTDDGSEFVFETSSPSIEYLPFPTPMYARKVRVLPKAYNGSGFQMDFDVVICKTFEDRESDAVTHPYHSYDEIMLSADESFWYVFYKHYCNCINNGIGPFSCHYNKYGYYESPNGYYSCECKCSIYGYKHFVNIDQYTERRSQFINKYIHDVGNFMVKGDNVIALDRFHVVRDITADTELYSEQCDDYEVTDEYLLCVQSNDHQVYKKQFSDETISVFAGCCFKGITLSPTDETLYGLGYNDSKIYQYSPAEGGLGEWTLLSDMECQSILVSKDKILWCLKSGKIYEWNSLLKNWILVKGVEDCIHFAVARSYILCVTQLRKIVRTPRSSKKYPDLLKIADYQANTKGIAFTQRYDGIFTYTEAIIWKIHSNRGPGQEWYKESDMSSYKEYATCDMVDDVLGDYYYYCCFMPNHITHTSLYHYPNSNYRSLTVNIDPSMFQVSASNVLIGVVNATKDIITIEYKDGEYHPKEYLAYASDALDFVYHDESGILYVLKSDSNIYKQLDEMNSTLYLTGPCTSFKINPLGWVVCMMDNILYIHLWDKWQVLIDEKYCDSYDLSESSIICLVINEGVFEKRYPQGRNYPEDIPLLSSGLQHFYDKSHGTGFMISYSTPLSLFLIRLQTSSELFVASLTPTMEWNDYSFIWNKHDNTLSVFMNSIFVVTVNSHARTATTKPWSQYVTIGKGYDNLAPFQQNVVFRDIKIWKHSFTIEEFTKDMFNTEDKIRFSEIYDKGDSKKDYKIFASCHKNPSNTGPCADADISSGTDASNTVYYFGPQKATFDEAMENCKYSGGTLAEIESEEDLQNAFKSGGVGNTFIKSHFNSEGDSCLIYNALDINSDSCSSDSCDNEHYYLCMATGYQLSKIAITFSEMIYYENEECKMNSYGPLYLAFLNSPETKFIIYTVDLNSIGKDTVVAYAYVSATIKNITANATILYVGVLQDNYIDCASISSLSPITKFVNYGGIKLWNISSESDDEEVRSPDLSVHINYFNHKTRNKENRTFLPIVLFWNVGNGDPQEVTIYNFTLNVVFSKRENYNFLLFPTSNYEPHYPPARFLTQAYGVKRQWFKFSYHMFGSDIGTLYVWLMDKNTVEKPYPAFYAHGNKENKWHTAVIKSPIDNVEWQLLFLAYRTRGPNGDIAIDNIQSFSNYTESYSNETDPLYTLDDQHDYLTILNDNGLPMPKLLFPFKNSFISNGMNNYSLEGGDVASSEWGSDKYGFPMHSLRANGKLEIEDISEVADEVADEFSILFHLRFNFTETPVVICQFGLSDVVIKISILNDKLQIKGETDLYESLWSFVEDTWTYVGIVFYMNKIVVYHDNMVDNITTTKEESFNPFPTSIHLFEDDLYSGLISCFQFYTQSLLPGEIKALEFCPDRIEISTCPTICKHNGLCTPQTSDCSCPDTVTRYYQQSNCEKVLASFFTDALVHLDFDVEEPVIDWKGNLNNINLTDLYLEPSPVNYGRCTDDNMISLGSFESSCIDMLDCDFVVSFWFYVDQIYEADNVELFKIANLVMAADFKTNSVNPGHVDAVIVWETDAVRCYESFKLPFNTWAFFYIYVNETYMDWMINGVPYNGNDSCVPGSENTTGGNSTEHIVQFGGSSKFCVDELSIFTSNGSIHAKDDLSQYYDVISKQKYYGSPSQWITNSVNYYPSVEFIVSTNIYWLQELGNMESYGYEIVKNNIETTISNFVRSLVNDGVCGDVRVTNMINDDGNVTANVNVHIKDHFTDQMANTFKGVHTYESKAYSYEIEWKNNGEGVPFAPLMIAASLYSSTAIILKINNTNQLNHKYHKGYYISTKILYSGTDQVFDTEVRQFFQGNDVIFYNHLVTYREYRMTVYSMTHEGYSEPTYLNFTTDLSENLIKPTIYHSSAYNKTAIEISWNSYPYIYWNSPNLLAYPLFYKKLDLVSHDYSISTYSRIDIAPNVTTYIITNLEQYTQYHIFLGTLNDIGVGKLDSRVERSGEGVPEEAPVIVNMTMNENEVMFQWEEIDNDIEIFNAPDFSGYHLNVTAYYPELVSPNCLQFMTQTGKDDSYVDMQFPCKPMKIFQLYISAFNWIGIGVPNEYCFVLPRTVPGQISVFDVTIGPTLENDGTSVRIQIGNISLSDENTVVTYYNVSFKSLDGIYDWKHFSIPIHHSEDDISHWNKLNGYSDNCQDFPYPRPSSKVIDYILPVSYYTNYTFIGMACSDEGCSSQNLNAAIETAEHIPICPPDNIRLFNTSSTSLRLTFDPITHYCLSGALQFYGLILLETHEFVRLRELGLSMEEIRNQSFVNQSLLTDNVFEGLHEHWNYTILVYAQNNAGSGLMSEPISAFTEEDVPHGPPRNCFVTHLNSSSFLLSIESPEVLDRNGHLHYEIEIINDYNEEVFTYTETVLNDILTVTFANLSKFTYQNISVYPTTKFGRGPPYVTRVQTLEDKPSLPPLDFLVQNITNDTLTLEWDDIPERSVHGVLKHFRLYGCGELRNLSKHCFEKSIDRHDVSFDIFPGTTYVVNISGCTELGCGPNATVEQYSLEMVPSGVVRNVSTPYITANSLNITWLPVLPMERRGEIIHYNISVRKIPHFWEDDSDYNRMFVRVERYLFIEALDNYTEYETVITASTEIGNGPETQIHVFRTDHNIPSGPPENVTGVDASSSELNITWLPLPPSLHEGLLLGYNISYNIFENFSDIRGGSLHGYFDCLSGEKTSCIIPGLSLGSPYWIQVCAYTIAGNGPWSEKVNASTGDYVDGNWTSWTEWGSCDRSCGLGKAMRQRWCNEPEPEAGGKMCPGPRVEFKHCNNFICPGYYLSNPGESCQQTCGYLGPDFACAPRLNFENTTKAFVTTLDIYNHTLLVDTNCQTSDNVLLHEFDYDPSYIIDSNVCRGYSNIPYLTNCEALGDLNVRRLCRCQDYDSSYYDEWANWGICTKSCGSGSYTRYRKCILPDNSCEGKDMDIQDCNTEPCKVHGQWGQWTDYSNCTQTCGDAVKIRTRKCDNPAPKFNGSYCPGTDTDVYFHNCSHMPCPVAGQWGEWKEVSECKHSCGNNSYRIQTRNCDTPAPAYGGKNCNGDSNRTYVCINNMACSSAVYDYVVRFVYEEWDWKMYDLNFIKSKDFVSKIQASLIQFYNSSELAYETENLVISFNELRKGSVIADFSITFESVPFAESLILQHEFEGGLFDNMTTELLDIRPDSLPLSPPANVSAVSITPFSINVSWSSENKTNLNGELYIYQVFYRKLYGAADNILWDSFGTKNMSFVIDDLEPGIWYSIRVAATTGNGTGVASPLINVITVEGVPFIKPPSCTYQILDERTVFFSWNHIPPEQVPGTLLGYEIKFREYFGTTWYKTNVDVTMGQRTIRTFKPYTWYWVEVAGYTSAGVGPHEIFVYHMPPGAPGIAPPNVTITDHLSTNEIEVTWDLLPEEFHNGDLLGYRLFYRVYQQGGVDLIGIDFVDVFLDRFTFSYVMTGLESYSRYEIHLLAYNSYGDGPVAITYGDTCKCPKYIFSNWYELKPYTIAVVDSQTGVNGKGLLPDLLEMVVNAVCTDCTTYTPTLYYNMTANGKSSLKASEDDVKTGLDSSVHISFPIFGRFELTKYAGTLPYIGIVQSQGSAMLIYQPRVKTIGLTVILGAVVKAWPVIVIAVLLAMMSGWILWFLEQPTISGEVAVGETDITRDRSIYGAYEGFWLSFISMTTLGYGDMAPSSNHAKAFMVLWVLTGLVIVSIFGGAVSSGMSAGSVEKEYKLYGTKVGVIKGSFEESIAIRRNAIIPPEAENLTTVQEVINAVGNGHVEIGFIDAISTNGYENEIEEMSLSIYKIVDLNSGYGVILSSEMARVESDMRSFITSAQGEISKFVEKKVGTVTPNLVEIEEKLLSADESRSLLTTLMIIYVIMAIIGIIGWLGIKTIRTNIKNRKVSPDDRLIKKHGSLFECDELLDEFVSKLDNLADEMDEKHTSERFHLYVIKESYKRKFRRAGLPEPIV